MNWTVVAIGSIEIKNKIHEIDKNVSVFGQNMQKKIKK
jgi:hypothetical protein